ncbi:MAG TPA: ABC transporter substrate-binding protein [Clostridiales bacterium]|nr:ABC transporter substrate-binding protein [Clostridiales bacterium]
MRKVLSLFMVLVMIAAFASGCSQGNKSEETGKGTPEVTSAGEDTVEASTPTAAPAELKVITVGYMPNYASMCTVVAGIQMNYFEEQGLKVNLVEFADGPTIIAAMESGAVDIGYIGPGAHKLCIQGKAKIFAFSHYGNADAVIGSASKGVSKIEDLKGKKIAMASGTTSETILNLTLAKGGLTKEDVEILDMDASAIVTAMISRSVDACATWSPNTNSIKEELGSDAVTLTTNVDFTDISPSICSWIANPNYIDANADDILSFTKALYKAMDYRAQEANIDQVVEWVADQVALDVESVAAQKGDGDWETADELIAMINDGSLEKAFQAQQDNFITSGDVKEKVAVSDYVMFQNMLDAAK